MKMENKNMPAMPVLEENNIAPGLTKREHFASMAPEPPEWYDSNEANLARRYFAWRCFYADSMLLELEK